MPAAAAGGRRLLEIQHDRRGVQLFGVSNHHRRPALRPVEHTQPARNLHRACTNLDTGSTGPIGFRHPRKVLFSEEAIGKKMKYAPQGVEGFLYVSFLPNAEAPCAFVLSTFGKRIFAPDDMLL